MGVKKNKIYQIYKVSTDTLTKSVNEDGATVYELKVDDFKNIEIVSISDNQVFRKILDYYGSGDKRIIMNSVINLVVPHPEHNSKKEAQEYEAIANAGFYCNNKRFKRLCSAAGQIRANTISFVDEELYDYLCVAVWFLSILNYSIRQNSIHILAFQQVQSLSWRMHRGFVL